MSQDAPVTKVWRKSVNRYWRYRGNIKLTRESRTDGRTHARTDGQRHGRTTRNLMASAGDRRRRLKTDLKPQLVSKIAINGTVNAKQHSMFHTVFVGNVALIRNFRIAVSARNCRTIIAGYDFDDPLVLHVKKLIDSIHNRDRHCYYHYWLI